MSNVYIAFDVEPVKDWKDRVIVPTYPSNWKPETVAKKQQEFLDGYGDKAATQLPTGNVVRIAMSFETNPEVSVGGPNALALATYTNAFKSDTTLIGIELSHYLKLCAWSSLRLNQVAPKWLWDVYAYGLGEGITAVNLYSLSGAKSASISQEDWLASWGYTWPEKAEDQVVVIRNIAESMGF
jgi:hypothetical protein